MSAKKTDVLKSWLIAITILFTLSPTIIFLAFSKSEGLSDQQKIESRTQALTTTATLLLGLAVMINAYYAAKRLEDLRTGAIATQKSLEIDMKNLQIAQERLIAERFMTAITQLGHESVANADRRNLCVRTSCTRFSQGILDNHGNPHGFCAGKYCK